MDALAEICRCDDEWKGEWQVNKTSYDLAVFFAQLLEENKTMEEGKRDSRLQRKRQASKVLQL